MPLQKGPAAWERYRSCAKQYLNDRRAAKTKFFSKDLLQTNSNKFWRMLSPMHRPNQIETLIKTQLTLLLCTTTSRSYFPPLTTTIPKHCPIMPGIEISPEGMHKLINDLKFSSSASCWRTPHQYHDKYCTWSLPNQYKQQTSLTTGRKLRLY